MSADRDVSRIVRSWLDEGVTVLPDRVLDAVLDQVPATSQRRTTWWPARRLSIMSRPIQIALAAVLLLAVVLVAYRLLPGNIGGPPTSSATPITTPTPIPTLEVGAGSLAAGSYQIVNIDPFTITITVPEGWESNLLPATVWSREDTKSTVSYMTVDDLFVDPCDASQGYLGVGPTVDDLAEAIAAYPGIGVISTAPVTLSGFSGTLLELSGTDVDCGGEGGVWITTQPGDLDRPGPGGGDQLWEVLILDVGGERLVIDRHVPGGASSTRLDDVRSIVDSTVIDTQ